MKTEISLIYLTVVVIAGLYMFQNRYEFFINNQAYMAVGDHWTGCVYYSRNYSIGVVEFRQNYPEYNEISNQELTERLHSKFFAQLPLEEFSNKFLGPEQFHYSEMIQFEC